MDDLNKDQLEVAKQQIEELHDAILRNEEFTKEHNDQVDDLLENLGYVPMAVYVFITNWTKEFSELSSEADQEKAAAIGLAMFLTGVEITRHRDEIARHRYEQGKEEKI